MRELTRGGLGGRRVVVFDVDGTLTRTNDLDGRCYAQALEERLGAPIDSDWAGYRHATDPGIFIEAFERRLGRPPDDGELAAFRDRFLSLLRGRDAVFEVPGAAALIRTLRRTRGILLAIATGAWRESAAWKLRCAGIPTEGIPMASGDDSPSREEIIRLAVRRAGGDLERTVYVGDAPWDVAAARRLGIPLVAVAADRDPVVLRGLGAPHVLGDFSRVEEFFRVAGLREE